MRLCLRAVEYMTTDSKNMLSLRTVQNISYVTYLAHRKVFRECIKKVGNLLHLPGPL
jgi:hypothetical protein